LPQAVVFTATKRGADELAGHLAERSEARLSRSMRFVSAIETYGLNTSLLVTTL